ncbi:MAG TPA: hypothetical protein VGC87_26365 [Pyrinomonadaceae bacterium]
MLKGTAKSEITILLLLIGGHSVAATLMEKQIKTAIYISLGVATCVLIFVLIQALISFLQKGDEDD